MAQYTKHPAAAPPTAPERESTGHLLLRGYVIVVLIAVFAHSGVYNLVGMAGSLIVIGALLLVTLALGIPAIARSRPHRLPWRRLPWVALGYAGLALLSLAWSQWPLTTITTWLLLAVVTVNALFIAHVLSWQEIIRALATAFKWIVGLSLAIELWVAAVLRHPLMPNSADFPAGEIDPHWYWVRGNLFDGGRIQGIVGNSNMLAILCLLALITLGIRFAAQVRWRATTAVWFIAAAFLLWRASSATAYLCTAAVAIVLAGALVVRRSRARETRRIVYAVSAGVAVLAAAVLIVFRDQIFAALGRSSDLTGRQEIWAAVLERVAHSPIVGNGFASPWIPTDPAFDGWITDHGISVFHAHDMWIDVLLQLGVVGLLLMAVAYLSLLWRAWFFAVDRPRWDLRDDRAFSPLSLLPVLFTAALLVHGIVESTPIMLWGWLCLVLFSFKIKAVPLVGVGLDEAAQVTERGPRTGRRVP